MPINYINKYIKYKNKYINLVKQLGGHDVRIEKETYLKTIEICKETIGSKQCIDKLLLILDNISHLLLDKYFTSDKDKKALLVKYDKLRCSMIDDNCSNFTSGAVKLDENNIKFSNVRTNMAFLYSIIKYILGISTFPNSMETADTITFLDMNVRYRNKDKENTDINKLNIKFEWPNTFKLNKYQDTDTMVYANNHMIEEFAPEEEDAYTKAPTSLNTGTNLFKLPNSPTITQGIFAAGTSGHTCRIITLCKFYIGLSMDKYKYHIITMCLIWMISFAHHSAREILLLLPIMYPSNNMKDTILYDKIYSLFAITNKFNIDLYIVTLKDIFKILVDMINTTYDTITIDKDIFTKGSMIKFELIENMKTFLCFAKDNIKKYDFVFNPSTSVKCS